MADFDGHFLQCACFSIEDLKSGCVNKTYLEMVLDYIMEIAKLILGNTVIVEIANNAIKEVATTHFNVDL